MLTKVGETINEAATSLHRACLLVEPPGLRRGMVAYYQDDLPEAAAWLWDAKAGIEEALRELGRKEARGE